MKRILFIDDDVLALQLMAKVTSLLGHQPILSTSPHTGLELAANEKPALILVDMEMDEMDGPEFVRRLRGSPGIADLPVIIYTAGAGLYDEKKALEAGANALLFKPVGMSQLSETIMAYTALS